MTAAPAGGAKPPSGQNHPDSRAWKIARRIGRIEWSRIRWFCSFRSTWLSAAAFAAALVAVLVMDNRAEVAAGEISSPHGRLPIWITALVAWIVIGIASANIRRRGVETASGWRPPIHRWAAAGLWAALLSASCAALLNVIGVVFTDSTIFTDSIPESVAFIQVALSVITFDVTVVLVVVTTALLGGFAIAAAAAIFRVSVTRRRRGGIGRREVYIVSVGAIVGAYIATVAIAGWPGYGAAEYGALTILFVILGLAYASSDILRRRDVSAFEISATQAGPLLLISLLPLRFVLDNSNFVYSSPFLDGMPTILLRPLSLFDNDFIYQALVFSAVLLFLFASARLKQDLVRQSSRENAAALSIYTDPERYNDDAGHAAWLEQLIQQNNGGVVGVTGLRGAGKSALLAFVKNRFKGRSFVLWMTAPTSHEKGLAFLTAVCRSMCRQVLSDTRRVLHGRDHPWIKAATLWLERSRWLLGGAILLVMTAEFVGTPAPVVDSAFRSRLLPPTSFSSGSGVIRFPEDATGEHAFANNRFRDLVLQEIRIVKDLLRKIEIEQPHGLAGEKAGEAATSYALIPTPREHGFSLIRLGALAYSLEIALHSKQWIESAGFLFGEEAEVYFVYSEDAINLNAHEVLREFADGDPESQRLTLLVHALLHDQLLGTAEFLDADDPLQRYFPPFDNIAVTADFTHTVYAAQMLRGHPAIETQLKDLTGRLRSIVGIESAAMGESALASEVFLYAFAESWDAGGIVLSAEQLADLNTVLSVYLDLISGRTLVPNLSSESTSEGPSSFEIHKTVGFLMDNRYLFVALVAVLVGPALLQLLNFMLRGALNHRLLGLAAESEDFLEFLAYSEGKEASASFAFRGLNIGGKRTLAARQLTLQALTDTYLRYVRILLPFYNNKIIVIIDELDKISRPDDVKNMLIELKGALFEKGCYYLMSISEDAARAFRGRLTEGRDIFESTFDEVIEIRQMPLESARAMVQTRLLAAESPVRLSDDSITLITIFAGAIPREIIRSVRETVLDRNAESTADCRHLGRLMYADEMESWLRLITEAPYSGEDLTKIHLIGTEILEAIRDPKSQHDWPDSVKTLLHQILAILDPNTLRKGKISDVTIDSDGNQNAGTALTDRHMAEIQACLRLLLLDLVMRDLWLGKRGWLRAADRIIQCARTVLTQPTLAEAMLDEIAKDLSGGRVDTTKRSELEMELSAD